MLVAWRRLDDVPADLSAARAWLFGVPRKTLQNTRRREYRHDAVAVRLSDVRHGPADAGHHPDLVACRVDIAAAWPLLSASDQEAIALAVLDGLTAPEAAAVLGISSTAFRLRCPVPGAPCDATSTAPPPATARPATPLPRGAPMNKQESDILTTAALRDLDPAPATALTAAERERAEATLARIVATPADGPVPVEADPAPRRRGRLMVPVGVAGVVGAAVPVLLLSGGSAYGSWTPTPEPLTGSAAAEAAATCQAALQLPDRPERDLVAERRGEWVYVLITDAGGEAACLLPEDLIGQSATTIGDERGFFGRHDPDPAEAPTLAPRRIDEFQGMSGTTDEGYFVWVEGYVGRDVTGGHCAHLLRARRRGRHRRRPVRRLVASGRAEQRKPRR